MEQQLKKIPRLLVLISMISLILFGGYAFLHAESTDTSRVTFYVA
jgi:hypothetical protein